MVSVGIGRCGSRRGKGRLHLLVVNPNTSIRATARIRDTAVRAAAAGTSVEAVSAPSGIALIESREQSTRAGEAVVRLLMSRVGDFEAAIIAAYSDPGLMQSRQCIVQPVVGIAEASILEASRDGRRFTVLMPEGPLVDYVRQVAVDAGVGTQLAAIRGLTAPLSILADAPFARLELFRGIVRRAIDEDHAEAIVVGGGPLAGVAERLAPEFDVPLLDGVTCAVRRAERLVRSSSGRVRSRQRHVT